MNGTLLLKVLAALCMLDSAAGSAAAPASSKQSPPKPLSPPPSLTFSMASGNQGTKSFVVQFQPLSPPPPTPTPRSPPSPPSAPSVPPSCAYTLMSDTLSWGDANAACQAAGLQLASVQSAEQNALLLTVVGDNQTAWIGGTDAASEGAWVWSPSNKPLSYTNWGTGEPNNHYGGDGVEDCLVFNHPGYPESDGHSKWNDLPCTYFRKYVCQTACPVPPSLPLPPSSPPSPPLPPAYPGDLNAWYCPSAFDIASSTWEDCSGNGKTATLSGSGLAESRSAGHGGASQVLALSGTTSSTISFGAVLQSNFTVCSVTRYTGGAKKVILGGQGGWLHGHWDGSAGVAYYSGWKTTVYTYPGNVSPNTDWVVMCGTNAGSQLKLVNGVDVGIATGGTGGTSLFVNEGDDGNHKSDFAIAEVVVWPRGLTSEEMHSVSDHLMNRMVSPPPPPPPSSPPSPPGTFTTKASLVKAVQEYNTNPTAAIATYGPVADWDVSAITDMSSLFYGLQNFNADISNWDTSGVTTMQSMFSVRSARALPP